jgi:pimeloyl-ACP methyl ester carboxylesterase
VAHSEARTVKRTYSRSIRLLLVAACAYLAMCVAMFIFQRDLLYQPDMSLADPVDAGLPNAQLEHLKTSDGEDLIVWWIPPRAPGKPVFLYFHGNGGNLSYRPKRLELLSEDGAGVMAVSWRGYGGSTGSPSEDGLMADGRSAYVSLRSRIDQDRIVLVGESLGSGVAVKLAAEVPVAAVILDSGYSSIADVAASKFPWLPVPLLIRDAFRADLAAGNVQVPVFQVHCTDDPVVPLVFGRRLHQLFPNRRDLIEVPGRCHPVSPRGFEAVLTQFRAETAAPD